MVLAAPGMWPGLASQSPETPPDNMIVLGMGMGMCIPYFSSWAVSASFSVPMFLPVFNRVSQRVCSVDLANQRLGIISLI